MTTTAELEQQLAEVQARIAELRLKFDVNKAEFLQAQREFFAAGIPAAGQPDNIALQQARIEAEAKFRSVAARIKPDTDALNAAIAQEQEILQEITTTAPTKARDKEEEETTINPKTDPTVNKSKEALTTYYDDGSSVYYNPDTGETITTTIDENGVPETESKIIIPQTSIDNEEEVDDPEYPIVQPVQESIIGPSAKDWRFRMSLAPSADYLYKANPPGILAPLIATEGVIFPYTPAITITYSSNYNAQDITHSNYKIYTYKNSAVEAMTISADFTAQDSVEANYLLAVIHFFRSVTKMFYGQDQNPSRGVPPPLVYLHGFGQYQFDWHPVVISSFTHTFPQDVDFVEAYPTNNGISLGALDLTPYENLRNQNGMSSAQRLRGLSRQVQPGGLPPAPVFASTQNINEATRVPTKLTIQLNCLPIVTRNAISNKFSLKEYATGRLMRGSVNPGTGGGIW
jgi:hypothetical protein